MLPRAGLLGSEMNLAGYRAILCDLDGCLISGDTVLPGAAELLAVAGARLVIVSNNSTDTPTTLSARLAAIGLEVSPSSIMLAGTAALEIIADGSPGARICVFGSLAIREYATALGLVHDEAEAEFVLLARDRDFSYSRLERLIRLVGKGARLVVTNIDASHPAPDGGVVPETGALLEAVKACLPGVSYRAVGKPDAGLFEAALRTAGAAPGEVLFIGDNPATDGEGARRLGMDFALVGRAGSGGWRDLAALLDAAHSSAAG